MRNLNPAQLKPAQCVADWARFFERNTLRPTLGCFAEHGHEHLPIARLLASLRDVPAPRFHIYLHGTVTDAELTALSSVR
jgi:hypothetical protein